MTTFQDEIPLAYCFKCREKREIQKPREMLLKNGRPALRGTCGDCGTTLHRLIPMLRGA